MRVRGQDGPRLFGIFLLLASIPLLVWQSEAGNQAVISSAEFLAAHSMMETFAIVVAALVFFTGYGAHETTRSVRSVVLGYAFLAVALLDALHFLSYAGMPDLISPNSPQKSILFWLCARIAAGIGLLAYILIPEAPSTQNRLRRRVLLGVLLLVAVIAYPFLTAPQSAPAMFVPGKGLTAIKIVLEWAVFGFYIAIAALLYLRRKTVTNCDIDSLLLALLLMAAGELFFTMYVQVSNTANLLGHAYKVAAYYFLYRAIYAEAVRQPFRQMRKMLTHDDLTGLPNRMAFSERLSGAVALATHEQSSCSVLLIDLDHFQNVNDTLGHELGDMLLMAVGARLRAALPESAFVARFSGDEFVILLERTTVEGAKAMGQVVLDAMAAEFDIGQDRLEIGASVGIVTCPLGGDSASVLMRHADLALSQAKAAGRNCMVVFSRNLADKLQRHVRLEAGLKHALEARELSLHYQPKIEVASGRIVGWEALLRWHSPELGAVSPAEFIPVAEQTGLILTIGDWVLHEACRQLREWRDAGLAPGSMAVNLSPRQFRQKDLSETIQAVLKETGLPAEMLGLEITESAIMDNLASAADVLAELEQQGVRIAVDDFGTGYSSLGYLKTFPIHCLKIDRSFIKDIPGNDSDAAIVRTVITLAGSLGLYVVAEGVETEEQLAYLRTHRCDQIQGYLFSRPLPPEHCVELMRSGPHRAVA